jgi:hypothetical protein
MVTEYQWYLERAEGKHAALAIVGLLFQYFQDA